jgi:hypothetical protein
LALFGRRDPAPDDIALAVATISRALLAEHGFETTIDLANETVGPQLIGADQWVYPLHNLILNCRIEPQKKWRAISEAHLLRILSSRANQPVKELDREMLLRQIRTRLLADIDDGHLDLSYARPFATGLVVGLCVDYPDTVTTISRPTLEELAVTADELFGIGQKNTNAEQIDEHNRMASGVWMIGGGSLFTASKIIDLDGLIRAKVGPAPDGIVFATPHRELILYVKPEGADFLKAVQSLLGTVDRFAHDPEAYLPGGLLSPLIYYSCDGVVEPVGGRSGESNTLQIDATGRFGLVLEKWSNARG